MFVHSQWVGYNLSFRGGPGAATPARAGCWLRNQIEKKERPWRGRTSYCEPDIVTGSTTRTWHLKMGPFLIRPLRSRAFHFWFMFPSTFDSSGVRCSCSEMRFPGPSGFKRSVYSRFLSSFCFSGVRIFALKNSFRPRRGRMYIELAIPDRLATPEGSDKLF